ncbi:MAG TPA: PHP domain-containing protein [Aggregatilineales bacterium]|nr:PHP domain-containing protein [Aggregatilineales bacterium]
MSDSRPNAESWKVELHSHTQYSKDCLIPLPGVIRTCQKRGIDRIAITDHNTAEGALALAKMAPELVIVGEEIMTTDGEILAYFVRETVPPGLTPSETIQRLRDQGAVISVAHPYDRLRKGAWHEDVLEQIVDSVDAIEVFNARCMFAEDNAKAEAFAKAHNKPATVGSDGHITYEYGHATLRMQPFEGPGDFFLALKSAVPETRPSPWWVHGFSSYAKFLRKRGLSHMPTTGQG